VNAITGRRPGLAGLSFLATLLALFAFAANSILCRLALATGSIDPATFTVVRLASGAVALSAIVALRHGHASILRSGDFRSAFALFAYAILFAFAYVELPAGTGALLLFGAVQSTMIGAGMARGERVRPEHAAGIALALAGLVALVAPRLGAPSFGGALAMLGAGVAWGAYSLRGRGATDPLAATAGNFVRAMPLALVPVALASAAIAAGLVPAHAALDPHAGARGLALAAISGALASGMGYAIWYAALPSLTATRAGVVQLTVPVIAALGGVLFLGEVVTVRLLACTLAVLGGVALALRRGR
jgi:drug/metabolite transporter (DMT)-like permease